MSAESFRKKILSDWRGLNEPVERPDKCASVGALLQKILPKLGLNERLGEQQVMEAWQEIVGDFLARHSLPVALSGGVLTVQVLQPSVRYELDRNWKTDILARLQTRFGPRTVREIRFRL